MDTTMPTASEHVELTTPLGEELLFHGMLAHDELSRPGEFQLDLLSKNKDVDRDVVLGGKVGIKVLTQDGSERFFNGFVTRFSAGGSLGRYARYHAVVKPWLWFLTRTADCRIFQDKSVKQIVEEVFADHAAVADFVFELTETYSPLKYCVQYRETDFNFVSRLLEDEGIYYYFRQTEGHHTLVMTDSMDKHNPTPGYEKLQYIAPQVLVRPGTEYISSWEVSREVQPGVYVHDDYDFERPSVDLLTSKTLPRAYKPSDGEVYDYPGFYLQKPDGERCAHVRIDEYGARFETAQAATNYRGVLVGARFTLEGHPIAKLNGDYLVVGATQTLESSQYESGDSAGTGSGFRCSFTALSVSQQFRPPRGTPKPFVQGPQTAVVVGPEGDEIYTDNYGRVKVQFHWDRKGKKNENSSCWIRVATPWAGKNWGVVHIPRIGQEVIVDFLEGDPDQPIVIGSVYNAEQMPPYALPGNKTQSGIVSRSSSGGSPETFNELMFEDKKGSELVYLRAEKDYTNAVENDEVRWVGHDKWIEVDNDETTTVGHDRTETVNNDETITIHGNRTETVDKDEKITIHMNRTETVDKDETITVHASRKVSVDKNETKTVKLQRSHTVGINETITVGGAQEVTVGGLQAVTVGAAQMNSIGGVQSNSIGAGRTVSVGGTQSVTIAKNGSMTISGDESRTVNGKRETSISKNDTLNVGKNLMVKASEEISITTGDASITMKKDGTIVIKGKDITIEGSGKINVKASKDIVMKGSKIVQN
jgi:type VI secretion system secreted protein VgrG